MHDKNNVWQITMNGTHIFLGVIFSSIGLGYFMYGKKQKMTVPLVCGLVLMIYPYFIESTTLSFRISSPRYATGKITLINESLL